MEGSDRAQAVIERLRTTEHVTVTALAEETGCSEMTIRRDLDQLAEQGVLRRVRGGAMSLLLRGESSPFAVREHEAPEVKQRLAARAAELISDGESVILDSGTTVLTLARTLVHRRITAVPLDLHSTNTLSSSQEITLLLPGGQTAPGALSFTGYLTETSLRALRADTAVLGVCGLSVKHGMTAHDLTETPIKQAAIASARRSIAVCHGAKFSRTGLGHVCPVTDLDVVITDTSAPAEEIAELERSGVVVHVV